MKKNHTFHLEAETVERMREVADGNRRHLSGEIQIALEEYIARQEKTAADAA